VLRPPVIARLLKKRKGTDITAEESENDNPTGYAAPASEQICSPQPIRFR
jgi:hypothetical protein